ncbi:MAG TPA: site-2 protease family protein [Gemmatimonadales bacterium]|nr:site-2 protease family protein [Gemmatimonadales bacterium]
MLVFSVVAHEYAHGAAAFREGDDTAYALGRLTLNPVPHIDPWLSVLLPALLWFGTNGRFTFGGAKPVPVNPRKYRHYRRGDIIVSAAGVVTNLGIALGCAALFVAVGFAAAAAPGALGMADTAQRMLMLGVWLNLMLCFFNLIPIPPLDGSHLFYHLLPPAWGARYRSLQRFGFLPLLALMLLAPTAITFLLTPAYLGMHYLMRLVLPYAVGEGWNIFQS